MIGVIGLNGGHRPPERRAAPRSTRERPATTLVLIRPLLHRSTWVPGRVAWADAFAHARQLAGLEASARLTSNQIGPLRVAVEEIL